MEQSVPRLVLFPLTASVGESGRLIIGGCDTVTLAKEFGTPLYIFDEDDLRCRCAEFIREFGERYPETTVCYSCKAFTSRAMLRLVAEEGLDLDVVSGGELGIARAAGFPMQRVHFPGNNKSVEELEMAIAWGIGHIIVDNPYELDLLREVAAGREISILLRLSPGIDPHTHRYNTTGTVDSKFGFPRATWDKAVTSALASPNLKLAGFHCHLGSGIFEMEPYEKAIDVLLDYTATQQQHGFNLQILDIGGGYGARYTLTATPPSIAAFAETITARIKRKCRELNLPLPRLLVEPGRAIVARAGVALYRVGAVKEIPGVRHYVSVDGGMGDNIRHALYGARHEALAANRAAAEDAEKITIAGKFCESGDILIEDIELPAMQAGDVLAVAGCGAYCLPTASNYNASFRPAVVMVRDGQARLIRRRETLEDLLQNDVF